MSRTTVRALRLGRGLSRALCLPILLAVLACATDGKGPVSTLSTEADTPVATGPTADDIQRDADAQVATVARPAQPTPKRPPPLADEMADLDPTSVKTLLGEPSFVRRDPPAEIWQYRPAGCVLDLFLYPANSEGDLRVRHVAARIAGGGNVTVADCAARILANRGQSG